MTTLRRTLVLALALAAGGAAANARAQCGAYGGGYGYGYWDIGRLYSVLSQNVPYYAAFPPVYYSVPVPRTYGYSPFAYPPGTMTPEVEIVEPLAITNPYFSGTSAEATATDAASKAPIDRTTAAPAVIVNPFVERGRALARR